MINYNKKLGNFGEDFARKHYVDLGFQLVGHNWQKRTGEIDLILVSQEEIIFVEVKTRTKRSLGQPVEAVTQKKKEKISKTIDLFLLENEKYNDLVPIFDIFSVEIDGLKVNYQKYENIYLKN